MKTFALAAVAALALAGCSSTGQPPSDPVVSSAPFDAAAAAFIKKPGTGTIQGHAFLKTPSGEIKHAGGELVRLVPVTPYSRNRFAQLYLGRKFVAAGSIPNVAPDPKYAEYTRTTKAESTGRFIFEGVAPGSYYVATQNFWRKDGEISQQGGAFYEMATVTGKEDGPVKVVVNGQ